MSLPCPWIHLMVISPIHKYRIAMDMLDSWKNPYMVLSLWGRAMAVGKVKWKSLNLLPLTKIITHK